MNERLGTILLVLAGAVFLAEIFIPSAGVLTVAALALLVIGVAMLFGTGAAWLVVPGAVVVAALALIGGRLALRARRQQPVWGAEGLLGMTAELREADGRRGRIFAAGTWWSVKSEQILTAGAAVRVKGVDGLELVVDQVNQEA